MAAVHGRVAGTGSRWLRRIAFVAAVPLVAAPVVVGLSASANASRGTYTAYRPNLQILVPYSAGQISIGTAANGDPQLQFTHDTYDAGPGPFEFKPHYNHKTGTATFTQIIFKTKDGGNSWRPAYSVGTGGTGVYQPGTSHYAFPMTSFALYVENPDTTKGALVATSPKIDYCITGDVQIANVFGTPNNPTPPLNNCSNPRKVLGWGPGYADQYDETDPGQPIDLGPGGDLAPNGNYILEGIVDPGHVFTVTTTSDDTTDTYLNINNGTVTVTGQTGPTAPQLVASVQSPAPSSHVSGTVTLKAKVKPVTGTAVSSVQYLLDGEPLGTPVTAAPYAYAWTVGTTAPGPHQLSARVTDAAGRKATASVETVNVARRTASSSVALMSAANDPAPAVGVVNPVPGETLSGTAVLAADASDNVALRSVQFLVDGKALGAPVTAAPYALQWNTKGTTGGPHTISAVATNGRGATTTSAPIAVTVQNPAPPMACFVMDTHVSAAGRGTVTSPSIHAAAAGDTLVAFVAAQGPNGSRQRAAVTGGGVKWSLVKRSNAGRGDAEIWTAHASGVLATVRVTSTLTHPRYGQQLTVIGMEGVNGVGAASAGAGNGRAPAVVLKTSGHTSLVFAVAHGAGALSGGLPAGWVTLSRSSDAANQTTSWIQTTNQPTGAAGSTVTVSAPALTGGQWNMAAAELTNDGG